MTIAPKHIRTIEEHAAKIAQDFQVKGILNVQFAICNDEVYIIEANPRASRTVPIVSKVTGISLARYATEIMLGKKLKELGLKSRACRFIGVKEAVFPFNMFPEVDPVLGPEMRATGEVMGIADNFGMAYYKAQEAAGCILPTAGKVLVTVSDRDKKFIEPIARDLISLGFTIVSTGGTAEYLRGQGVETEVVNKLHEGRPNLGDMITNKQIDLITTIRDRTRRTILHPHSHSEENPYMTTIAAARATVEGIRPPST
ncbi:MAG: ATP-grasp domain-containing protein [Akkermansia muciniphila]